MATTSAERMPPHCGLVRNSPAVLRDHTGPPAERLWGPQLFPSPERHTQGLSSRQYGTHNCRHRWRSVETRLGAYMIRSLCTFLVLSCVAGLSGVLTGHLWNRYADENGLLRLGGIYQRIQAVQTGFIDVAQGYWAAAAPRDRLTRQSSALEE
jgi:hypothetical protein